jgi:hypothetical protein
MTEIAIDELPADMPVGRAHLNPKCVKHSIAEDADVTPLVVGCEPTTDWWWPMAITDLRRRTSRRDFDLAGPERRAPLRQLR